MNSTSLRQGREAVKKTCGVIVIDETVKTIVFKSTVSSVKIEDEVTAKAYRIQRTPVKRGLQMTGA
jgi:hypothetical protein